MTEKDHPSEPEEVERDTVYSPASESEMEQREDDPRTSAATEDADIDPDDVKVLPGTGGPDDPGDVDVDPDELNLDGNPT